MTVQKYLRVSLPLALAGTVFAGYLSAVKIFSKSCAFGESCPLFLGYPACYYGFAIFLVLAVASTVGLVRKTESRRAVLLNTLISGLGVLFSGYFVWIDIGYWLEYGFAPTFFGLSTCAYGFGFFLAVLVYSLVALMRIPSDKPAE